MDVFSPGTPLSPVPCFTPYRKYCAPRKFVYAARMRRKPTKAEAELWRSIKCGCAGFKFRNQSVILGWIVDFYCPAAGLVIEVDGGIHNKYREYDRHRTEVLERIGLRVIRFTNEEVLDDVQIIFTIVRDILLASGLPRPTYTPKPGGLRARWIEGVTFAKEKGVAIAPYYLECPECHAILYWLKYPMMYGDTMRSENVLHPDGTSIRPDELLRCECHPESFRNVEYLRKLVKKFV